MKFDLTIQDFTIIQNALHYYKAIEKKGNFQTYNEAIINSLRDKLARQFCKDNDGN